MKWVGFFFLYDLTLARISHRSRRNEEDPISVIIGMKAEDRQRLVSKIADRLRPGRVFKRINAMSIDVTPSELEVLRQDPDVLYVEEDALVYPDAEAILYGQEMIQAQIDVLYGANLTVPLSAACNNPKSFKIGVRILPCRQTFSHLRFALVDH